MVSGRYGVPTFFLTSATKKVSHLLSTATSLLSSKSSGTRKRKFLLFLYASNVVSAHFVEVAVLKGCTWTPTAQQQLY